MYFVIAKLDINKMLKMDYILNFGVTVNNKNMIVNVLENGGDYDDACRTFK